MLTDRYSTLLCVQHNLCAYKSTQMYFFGLYMIVLRYFVLPFLGCVLTQIRGWSNMSLANILL